MTELEQAQEKVKSVPCPFCECGGKPEIATHQVFEHLREKIMDVFEARCGECLVGFPTTFSLDTAVREWTGRNPNTQKAT